ncbi:MAG: TAXI family TRAP transporter solute-binding subunit [Alphaproteobacteria bacterium]
MNGSSGSIGRRGFVAGAGAAGLAAAVPSGLRAASTDAPLRLLTAPPGDAYYPIGIALATLVKIKLLDAFGTDIVADTSPGAQANPSLLKQGKGDLAFTQHYTLATAGFAGREGLQTIATLWPTFDHVLIDNALVQSGTLADLASLKGRAAYFGKPGSAAYLTNTEILNALSLDPEKDFDLFAGTYEEAADALLAGEIAAASLPGAVPVKAVRTAFGKGADRVRLLTINREERDRIDDDRGIWAPARLNAGTYNGQAVAVDSLRQPNVLVVRDGVPRKTVYRILDAIFSDVAFLHQIHPATKDMTVTAAAAPTLLPFHPGAEEFYLDHGIDVTDV